MINYAQKYKMKTNYPNVFYQIRRKDKKNDNCNQNWNKTLLLFHQDYSKKHLSNNTIN